MFIFKSFDKRVDQMSYALTDKQYFDGTSFFQKNLPKSYYIFKEFMMTERTAVFDLKILAQVRDAISNFAFLLNSLFLAA